MNLVDMKLPQKDKKDTVNAPVAYEEKEEYPYSLRIRLEKEQLEKLAIFELLDVDATVDISAKGIVIRKRSNEMRDGKDISLEIQIKSIGVEPEKPLDETDVNDFMARRNKR